MLKNMSKSLRCQSYRANLGSVWQQRRSNAFSDKAIGKQEYERAGAARIDRLAGLGSQ